MKYTIIPIFLRVMLFIDFLQNVFIWCLYVVFPTILFTRHVGFKKTALVLGTLIVFNTLTSSPDDLYLNVIKSTSNDKDLTTIILASSHGDKPDEKTLPSISRKNKKKFDLALHIKLEEKLPDWDGRVNYQKKQEKFYESAMKKQAELRRLRVGLRTTPYYTKEELDAISYFKGTGFYAKQQNPKMKPNIFDTRETLLLKMQDKTVRKKYIESLNRLYR